MIRINVASDAWEAIDVEADDGEVRIFHMMEDARPVLITIPAELADALSAALLAVQHRILVDARQRHLFGDGE